jgi:hypothetical protein
MSTYLDKLPNELLDYIYLLVHNMNTLKLNKIFKQVIRQAKYYHILQIWRPSNKLKNINIESLINNLEYTKCCFKGPKKLKYVI